MNLKRTELFKIGDYITDNLRNGVIWRVEEIKESRNGMLLQRADHLREKAHMFLSNTDSINYFKVDKISGEYDTMNYKYIPKEKEY